jgi:hypothetical protein
MSDESELTELKKQVAELKDQINPPPRPPSTYQPYDPTANFSMPASALQEMLKAVPEALMRSLREDARRPNPVNPSTPSQPTTQVQRGSGWVSERKLEPPPGIEHMDRMMDAQARVDKAELALKLAKVRMAKGKDDEQR